MSYVVRIPISSLPQVRARVEELGSTIPAVVRAAANSAAEADASLRPWHKYEGTSTPSWKVPSEAFDVYVDRPAARWAKERAAEVSKQGRPVGVSEILLGALGRALFTDVTLDLSTSRSRQHAATKTREPKPPKVRKTQVTLRLTEERYKELAEEAEFLGAKFNRYLVHVIETRLAQGARAERDVPRLKPYVTCSFEPATYEKIKQLAAFHGRADSNIASRLLH